MLGEKDKVKSFAKKDRDSLDQGDRRGFTAYHHACANGHAAVVKALLKAGCDTAAVNDSGRCAPVLSGYLSPPPPPPPPRSARALHAARAGRSRGR